MFHVMKKEKGSSVPSDGQAKEKLALYVYEYLCHIGATKTAQTFLGEIRWEKNIALGDPPGYLMSWWCVFWDLYCAAPERRDANEHSSEAKAFHDYFTSDGAHGPPPPPPPPPPQPPPSFYHPGAPPGPPPSMPNQQPPPPPPPLPAATAPMAPHPHPSQVQQQYMAASRFRNVPVRHQVQPPPGMGPNPLDPRQVGPRMMMPGQSAVPPGAIPRMPMTHPDPRIPPQGFHPGMRQPPTALGLHPQGMPNPMIHHNNVRLWNQQNSNLMGGGAGTPVTPGGPGPPHHPHMPHPHSMMPAPLSTASPSPRTPLEGPPSVGSPFNQPYPGTQDGPSLPLNVGPEPQYSAPMMNGPHLDGHHNMSLAKDGDIPHTSSSTFPPLGGPYHNDDVLRSGAHSANDEIRKIKETIGEEAKRFEKVNATDGHNDMYPAM